MTAGSPGEMLEALYRDLNAREYVHPDPLEFLYDYDDPGDREVVALVASSLAYGRVAQILKSVSAVLALLGPHPRSFLLSVRPSSLRAMLDGFRHRIYTGADVADMLAAAAVVLDEDGSLEACFMSCLSDGDETVIAPLTAFVRRITAASAASAAPRLRLLPDPAAGSACKRLNLMLRWLVRRDDVDPGGWPDIDPAMLVIPLDTHMHRIGAALGMTGRKSGDLKTALEVTAAFRRICPADPVRYDFALTRLGIRGDMDLEGFLRRYESMKNSARD